MMAFAALKIYNTLSRRVEVFKPLVGRRVFMFVCGPTVYDYSHLGHARVFVFFDTVARYLKWLGYSVFYIVNITDVDDKIVNRARELGRHPLDLAREYEKYFAEDMASLNVTTPNLYPRASDYLKEIFEQVEVLIKKGHAYVTPTGVYFDITTFRDYGKLSGRRPEELRVHRIEPDPTKRNPGDFALWRVKPREEFGWESPWGYGRPGWHIEDTAITLKHFGPQYDIHGGAIELAFPHHEAEIAQAESVTGVKPFVRYWMHVGLLTVEGRKMSKSLGNIVTIREALKKFDADTIRLFILSTHYRSPIDFRWELLESASKLSSRLRTALSRLHQLELRDRPSGVEEAELARAAEERLKSFVSAMNSDLNTPVALSELSQLLNDINAFTNRYSDISREAFSKVVEVVNDMLYVMGLRGYVGGASAEVVSELVKLIVDVRSVLRSRRDWELADLIRERLRGLGVELQDTPSGTKWVLRRA